MLVFFDTIKAWIFFLLLGVGISCAAVFLPVVFAQSTGSGTAEISISVSTPVPQFSLTGSAGQLEVRWNWDFISPGYYPAPVTEVRVEISNDALNYGNLQVHAAGDFLATYTGLVAATYTAQITIVDGNDYDYIVGPVTISSSTPGVGGRGQPPEATNLTVSGVAYPGPSTVVIFTYEGGFETTVNTSNNGTFTYQTNTLPIGTGTFSFSAKDPNNVLSAPVTFDYTLPADSPVAIDRVYLPPTIRIDSSVVTVGDVLQVSGYGFADGSISLDVDGPYSRAYLVQIDPQGFWTIEVDTADLGPGTYNISAQSTANNNQFTSPFSEVLVFELVLPLPAPPVCGDGNVDVPEQCDDGNGLNGDGCSAACQSEAGLPVSSIQQPAPTIFTSEPIVLQYTASSPSGAVDFVEVYYSRNGSPYQLYGSTFADGTIELTGLIDGDYEVYSVAHAGSAVEIVPIIADATFEIDQVAAFNILAYPEKRSPRQGNWALPVRMTVYEPGDPLPRLSYDFWTDNQGRYDIDAETVPPADYTFLLKGISHLSKRLDNLAFRGTDLFVDFSLGGTFYLLAGDVHPSKDDYINGLDVSAMVFRIYSSFVDADLNRDGFVNGMDLSVVISNLFKRGEGV